MPPPDPRLSRATPAAAAAPEATDRLLRQFVGYNMKRAFLRIQDDIAETLAPLGLRVGTFSALAVVMDSPGISQTQLSRVLDIKRSGVVVVVDELERAGALERTAVDNDRRTHALRVTPDGARLWQKAERAVQAHEATLFADLDAGQIAQLRTLLRRASDSAARHRHEGPP